MYLKVHFTYFIACCIFSIQGIVTYSSCDAHVHVTIVYEQWVSMLNWLSIKKLVSLDHVWQQKIAPPPLQILV